jgi:Holliday junction DNA helicase RuvA
VIARLVGQAVERTPGRLVVDVEGVGYEVFISLNTFAELPAEGPVTLQVHTHVREGEITLYGFAHGRERSLFRQLQTVAGIGPRLALGILSQMPAADLARVIRDRSIARLVALPGVGRRTAERIVTELSEKMADVGVTGIAARSPADARAARLRDDARLALLNLGYRDAVVEKALDEVLAAERDLSAAALEDVLRRSLQVLSGT